MRLNHISRKFREFSINNIAAQGKQDREDIEDEPIDEYDTFIDARLENVQISAMADTGNLFRFAISKALADKIGIQNKDIEPLPGYSKLGTAADGEPQLQVIGRLKRPLRLNLGCGTRDILAKPIVLANLSMHANLSGPFLKQHGIDILSTGFARYQGKDIPLVRGNGDLNAMKSIHSLVYTSEEVVIGANEGMMIPCVAKSVADGSMKASSVCVTGDGSYPDKFDLHAVTAGIVNVDAMGNLAVPTANTTEHTVTVPKGALYGSAVATATWRGPDAEKWKVCLLQPLDSLQNNNNNSLNNVAQTKQPNNDGPVDKIKSDESDKVCSPTDKDFKGIDFTLESYMNGETKLPKQLSGPTTRANMRFRIAFLIRFFHLDTNENLRDKVDLYKTIKVLMEFWPIFAWDGNYGSTKLMEHRIEVEDSQRPICQKHRPSNPLLDDNLKTQLATWLRHGVIEESNSPWNFALVPAVKKGGKIRWCCGKP